MVSMFAMIATSAWVADHEAARTDPRPPRSSPRGIMQRFTDLKVWQRGHALVLELYRATGRFPVEERFGLTAQLRRSAISVPTNIAEGSKRQSNADYARFLNIAEASLAETEYLLILSRDLGYLDAERVKGLLDQVAEIARMLHALRAKVEQAAGT
jgi:four helix bundle protein